MYTFFSNQTADGTSTAHKLDNDTNYYYVTVSGTMDGSLAMQEEDPITADQWQAFYDVSAGAVVTASTVRSFVVFVPKGCNIRFVLSGSSSASVSVTARPLDQAPR